MNRQPDQTGLILKGRSRDGRYLYESYSVMRRWTTVRLTNDQRIGLALMRAVACEIAPGTRVYPMTRQGLAQGYGERGRRVLWITRPLLEKAARSTRGLDVLAHEMAHNVTLPGQRPHGEEFKRAEASMRVAVARVTKGRTTWPTIDMRQFRESEAPHLRKQRLTKERKAARASETAVERWTRELQRAERLRTEWERKAEAATRKLAKYEKAVRKAERWLAAAKEREAEPEVRVAAARAQREEPTP